MSITNKCFVSGIILAILLNVHAPVHTQPMYYSIGPKAGYTFGEQGGWTFGGEVSLFPEKWNGGYGYVEKHAITVDCTVGPSKALNLHLGYEDVSLGTAGADIGPSLIIEDGTPHLGLSLIFFGGLVVYPYFELQYFPTRMVPVLGTGGSYLKFPVGTSLAPLGSVG